MTTPTGKEFVGPGSRIGTHVQLAGFGTSEQTVARLDLRNRTPDVLRNNVIATINALGNNDTLPGALVRLYALNTQINVKTEIGRGRVNNQGLASAICARHTGAFAADVIEMSVIAPRAHNPAQPYNACQLVLEAFGNDTSAAVVPPFFYQLGIGTGGVMDPLSTDLYELDVTSRDTINDAYIYLVDGPLPTVPGTYASPVPPFKVPKGGTIAWQPAYQFRFEGGLYFAMAASPAGYAIPIPGGASSVQWAARIA